MDTPKQGVDCPKHGNYYLYCYRMELKRYQWICSVCEWKSEIFDENSHPLNIDELKKSQKEWGS